MSLDRQASNRQAVLLARRFRDMRALTPVGCGEAEVAAVATWLREAEESYTRLWHAIGFADSPKVQANVLVETEYPSGAIWISFGAEEIPIPAARIEAELNRLDIPLGDGVVALNGPTATSWLCFHDPIDRTIGRDPFVSHSLSVSRFFEGNVIAAPGVRIRRIDAIKYACYRKRYTHVVDKTWSPKHRAEAQFLDQLDHNRPLFKRNNVDYLLLSIARDLSTSADVERFIATAFCV